MYDPKKDWRRDIEAIREESRMAGGMLEIETLLSIIDAQKAQLLKMYDAALDVIDEFGDEDERYLRPSPSLDKLCDSLEGFESLFPQEARHV